MRRQEALDVHYEYKDTTTKATVVLSVTDPATQKRTGRVLGMGVARLSPGDFYDVGTGEQLALARALVGLSTEVFVDHIDAGIVSGVDDFCQDGMISSKVTGRGLR